jgi:hypothetical protein
LDTSQFELEMQKLYQVINSQQALINQLNERLVRMEQMIPALQLESRMMEPAIDTDERPSYLI